MSQASRTTNRPSTLLPAATDNAAQTTKLRLGTGIIVLPQRNPVVLAKQLASLDVLSGGRLLFGMGVGYLEPELAELPRIAQPKVEAHRLSTGQSPLEIEPVEAGWQLICTGCGEVSAPVPYRWQVLDQTVTCRCA